MDDLHRLSVDDFRKAEKMPVEVVLHNVRSMHNVGSVFRTADAFRVQGIRLCGYTPCPPHRDIRKTALGATETVQWQYTASAREAVEQLKSSGYRIFAVEQVEKSIPLHEFSHPATQPLALIFGNEVSGVEPELLQFCEGCLEIPQFGMKHSLNISVAAGIVLWELAGKKMASGALAR